MRALLEASEILGRPATSKELMWMTADQIGVTNATKVCSRAISHGLMWGDDERPRRFQAIRGWREMVEAPRPEKPEKPEKPFHPAPQLTDVRGIARKMGPLFTCWGNA